MKYIWIVLFGLHIHAADKSQSKLEAYIKRVLPTNFQQAEGLCQRLAFTYDIRKQVVLGKHYANLAENLTKVITDLPDEKVQQLVKQYYFGGIAMDLDYVPLIRMLYNKGIDLFTFVPPPYWNKQSILHWAVYINSINFAEFLLKEKKIDPNLQINNGDTPLHVVVKSRDKGLMEWASLLIKYGADIRRKNCIGLAPVEREWLIQAEKNHLRDVEEKKSLKM